MKKKKPLQRMCESRTKHYFMLQLPVAAEHCGMTQKEMKMTFREYLKYNEPDYDISQDAA